MEGEKDKRVETKKWRERNRQEKEAKENKGRKNNKGERKENKGKRKGRDIEKEGKAPTLSYSKIRLQREGGLTQ